MKLLEELNIKTCNLDLYEAALTHTSYANENETISYERLEYLGDAALDLIIGYYLYDKTNSNEGEMTKLRAKYVCEDANYAYSIKLKLNEHLKLGRGESENGGKFRKAIVADIFESFIGALFLDKGFDFTKNFIFKHIIPLIENNKIDFDTDFKSLLQEFVQTDKRALEYIVVNEEGPAHNKMFTINAKIDNIIYGIGSAHSKKEAEQKAAEDALKKAFISNEDR